MRLCTSLRSRVAMDSLSFLAKEAPGFAVRGSQVKILTQPSQFYEELCKRAASSNHRIVLASLYLGTGEKEKFLVESVRQSLERNQGQVRVKVLLDFCRGNRDVKGENSCTVLKPLLEKYRESCDVSLYHTPSLRGLWKRLMPQRYNETIGLQHCKIYVFDDAFLISGANLSEDYFTNRQDRYVLIEDCPKLADYFEELTQNISNFSFKVVYKPNEKDKNFDFVMSDNWTGGHPYKGKLDEFVKEANKRLSDFVSKQTTDNKLELKDGVFKSKSSCEMSDCDTWIFPSIQMGTFGINQDSELTTKLLESAPEHSTFRFGTGYFNLTQEYLHVIMHKSKAKFDLLMAHPTANGFLGASFPAGGIPAAYTLIANKFFDLVDKNEESDRIKMFEYQRPGWTFHAKGVWHYLAGQTLPSATLVGSPNFGFRSVEKDLEAQITIVTKNSELQRQMHLEQERLFIQSTPVTRETFDLPERKIPTWVKWVVATARKFF